MEPTSTENTPALEASANSNPLAVVESRPAGRLLQGPWKGQPVTTESGMIPGTPVPATQLYNIVCTPVSKLQQATTVGPFNLFVTAVSSTEATRKAVAFFRNLDNTVTGIDILSMSVTIARSQGILLS